MAEFYAPYTDLAEMVNGNQSVYAFLYASRDLQGVLRTTDTILQQLERRDEVQEHIPADTRRPPNVDLMLGHRLRRWPNIKSTLRGRLVFVRFMVLIKGSCQVKKNPKIRKKLAILDRFQNLFFILYISEVIDSEYAKIINKKPR